MALRTPSTVHLSPCAGAGTPIPPEDVDADGKATCPTCGRLVSAQLHFRPWDPRHRTISRHGFTEGPKLPGDMPMADARRGLRIARAEYDQWAPGYRAAVTARQVAVRVAADAGLSDIDIAEELGIPRANVQRMRARLVAKRAPDVDDRAPIV